MTLFRPQSTSFLLCMGGTVGLLAFTTQDAEGQRRARHIGQRHRNSRASAAGDLVNINYPGAVNLTAFVDYVSQTLEMKILYGDELRNQTIVLRPDSVQVPKSQLLDLLRSMLRMEGLALVEGDVAGWLRIVRADDMQRYVQDIRQGDAEPPPAQSNRVVTQVVTVASEDFAGVARYARLFLSSPKASVIEVAEKNLLIITDYESAIAKALEIIRLVDEPQHPARVVSVPVGAVPADQFVASVNKVLVEKAKLEGKAAPRLAIHPHPSTGSILLIGTEKDIEAAQALIAELRAQDTQRTAVPYRPNYIIRAAALRAH